MTILITGGTGLVGHRLATLLVDAGHTVNLLTRNAKAPVAAPFTAAYGWDVENNKLDEEALVETDVIVHLAGAGIADKPWTAERKKEILDSRVNSSKLLVEALKYKPNKVKAVISASASGYYGFTERFNRPYEETDPAGTGFLADTCKAWEDAISQVESLGKRLALIRIGIVLSSKGGALKKIADITRATFGTALGTGNQAMPWIHIDDLCTLFIRAIENETYVGSYNGAAPAADTNQTFTKAVAQQFGKFVMPINAPAFVINTLYGEMAQVVLEGARLSTTKTAASGMPFAYTHLPDAIADLYKRGL